ncbi:hypothetical protein [Amycolatopsis sp. NPDC001319]|uniref:hypothetical protein n=1 Tax=unclassified Amycolatopsis TaxID=2618356 RepID=UPI00367A0146
MLLPRRLIAVAFVVAAAAGCSATAAKEPVATPSPVSVPATTKATTKTSAPPSTASTFVPAASPAKLSAACPFMDIDEYKRAFLVSQELVTSEEAPDKSNGITWYTCDYIFTSSHQTKSGDLLVFASPGETSVKASLKISAESCA